MAVACAAALCVALRQTNAVWLAFALGCDVTLGLGPGLGLGLGLGLRLGVGVGVGVGLGLTWPTLLVGLAKAAPCRKRLAVLLVGVRVEVGLRVGVGVRVGVRVRVKVRVRARVRVREEGGGVGVARAQR